MGGESRHERIRQVTSAVEHACDDHSDDCAGPRAPRVKNPFPRNTLHSRLLPFDRAARATTLSHEETAKFFEIIANIRLIKRHFDLFRLLQSDVVQYFIPHDIFISGWGHFSSRSRLTLDVVSAIPGIRTGEIDGCDVEGLLRALHLRWLAHKGEPMLLSPSATAETSTCSRRDCALHQALQSMDSALVYGMRDMRDGTSSVYLAVNSAPFASGEDLSRLRFVADQVVAQIDAAFRKVSEFRPVESPANSISKASSGHPLSAREQEILDWVAHGRTNNEIASIASISSFTVKNHVQRIIRKLGVSNRTEAVARYHQAAQLWGATAGTLSRSVPRDMRTATASTSRGQP